MLRVPPRVYAIDMPRLRAIAASALIGLLGLALPARAAPIVFDFEDGMQGWITHGGATRVQTDILGGDWAILIDTEGLPDGWFPFANIIHTPGLRAFSVEYFLTEQTTVQVTLAGPLPFVDVSAQIHLERPPGHLVWGPVPFAVPAPLFVGLSVGRVPAYVDNIIFYTVPEPKTAGLLSLCLAMLLALRGRGRVHYTFMGSSERMRDR